MRMNDLIDGMLLQDCKDLSPFEFDDDDSPTGLQVS